MADAPLAIAPAPAAGLAAAVTIRNLAPGDEGPGEEKRWDAFVAACPDSTFFHLAGWRRVIETAFRHRTYYLMAERDGVITGVLPLTLVKTRLFGASLISNAFCVQAGPIAADTASLEALDAAAVRLMEDLGVPVLELRSAADHRAGWLTKGDLYASFRKPIDRSADKNMKAIPRKQRAMVRKGIQNGLTSEIDRGADRLHRVYGESVRNLGTPVFPRKYFELLLAAFPEQSDIVTIVTGDGKPVASVLNFYFRDEVLPYYGGGTSDARRLAANDFMYWEVMRRACERGCRVFDFGRSKVGTGAYDFKTYWGFEPAPLVYQFKLAPGKTVPDLNPLNPKFALFVKLWKKLPLAVAARLGPPLVRGLG
jgi:FemAB-related protein (PEP-CTERM system-associated)